MSNPDADLELKLKSTITVSPIQRVIFVEMT